MHETGRELKPAVEAYLTDPATLTLRQIAVLKAYLFQWISSGVWDMNPDADDAARARLQALRESAGRIVTVADIHAWLMNALDEGIDPL
jgi:coproporphyrinogen III oxidase-like Fe-S oxidoreductase